MKKIIARFEVTDKQAAWVEKLAKETGQSKASIMRNLIQAELEKGK
ncbi:MAG: ribbon-helix-helix protein, CopG family [Deltaproteobacteria bacterium]|nr:ribbon-helix-helix protein, CopG family [Deltaproteobacteria bacterium]